MLLSFCSGLCPYGLRPTPRALSGFDFGAAPPKSWADGFAHCIRPPPLGARS